uniref:F-box domain-containing protein n=1 Tax=Ananas comosus var. bracteatus TaxID=296719 RepID=A0A6V7NS75_ANACO|nr:unnamed protein product [Ananas comosus var. bracteatus]
MLGTEGTRRGARRTVMADLPESCVAEVLLHLDPPEICRMARLSRTFRGAASADAIWAAKLPRNYGYLMAVALGGDDCPAKWVLTKKETYAWLCRRNPFDGAPRNFGWKRRGEVFACRFRRRRCRLRESMIGDTGITSQLKNQDFTQLLISIKYGGSK